MKQTSSIRTIVFALLTLTVSVALPSQLFAQDVAAPSALAITSATTAVAAQPSVESSTVAAPLSGPRDVQAGIARRTAAPMLQPMQQGATSRNVAWMIVGGATLVVGSVIGGDAGTIMMVTGGVIGLVGLMRYLQ